MEAMKKKPVLITVDGRRIEAVEESSLLEALLREGWDIPTFCHHEAVRPYGACRLCLVEVNQKGWKPEWRKISTSCNFPVLEGLTVYTDSDKVLRHRRLVAELLLARCPRSAEVREMAERLGVERTRLREQDEDCILCGLCARVCAEIVGAHAITFNARGGRKGLSTPFAEPSRECIACGACVFVCPVSCIKLVQDESTRTIDRWGVSLEMAVSKRTGLPFAPRKQLDGFALRAGLPPDFYDVAPGEIERR